jgi:hypothetical protein
MLRDSTTPFEQIKMNRMAIMVMMKGEKLPPA